MRLAIATVLRNAKTFLLHQRYSYATLVRELYLVFEKLD